MKKKILAVILCYSGIVWLYYLWMRIFGSSKLRILCYHRVMDTELNRFEFNEDLIDATVSDFERQMRFISRHFNVITFQELSDKKKAGLPKNLLIITFDDGYRDNYTNAYHILKKYSLAATIFLATGYIETDRLFWWDRLAYLIKKTSKKEVFFSLRGHIYKYETSTREKKLQSVRDINRLFTTIRLEQIEDILKQLEKSLGVTLGPSSAMGQILSWPHIREMSQNGIEFGSHTHYHAILTNLSLEEVKNEIVSSRKEIEQNISKSPLVFAFPDGSYDSNCPGLLKENGFEFACSYNNPGITSTRDLWSHPYELKRIDVDSDQNMEMFKARLCFPELMAKRILGNRQFDDLQKRRP